MDTANSLAIQYLENLINLLSSWRRSGSLRDRSGYVERLESLLKEMKYSYLESEGIQQRYIKPMVDLLQKILAEPLSEKQRRFIAYIKEEVEDLPRKLKLNPTEPFQVFRYRFVKIVSVSKHPTLPLKITKVRDSFGVERTVVTNVLDVKEGEDALIVILPPREFDGVWSEAMFVQFGVSKPEDVSLEELKRLNAYFTVKY